MAAEEAETIARAVTLRDVAAADFIKAYAAHLKKGGRVSVPKWVDYVKTGIQREMCPDDLDWYYVRAAAVARKIYLMNGIGIGALRRMFGGAKDRGNCPQHHAKSSGGVIRSVLQALEEIGVVEKDETRGGRRKITRVGQRDLDRIAGKVVSA